MKGQTTNKTNIELENCKWKAQYSYDMSNYLLDSVRKLRGKNDVLKMKIGKTLNWKHRRCARTYLHFEMSE